MPGCLTMAMQMWQWTRCATTTGLGDRNRMSAMFTCMLADSPHRQCNAQWPNVQATAHTDTL